MCRYSDIGPNVYLCRMGLIQEKESNRYDESQNK